MKGAANCHARLKDGASKVQILFELFTSTESREIGAELPGLRDAFAREGLQVVEEKKYLQLRKRPTRYPPPKALPSCSGIKLARSSNART